MKKDFFKTFAVVAAFLCLAAIPSLSQNLITNGGFETGDFRGWTPIGDTSYTGVCLSGDDTDNCSGREVFDGQWKGDFGAVYSLGGIQQTVATTPGQTYTFSFWMESGYSPPPNAVSISF